MGTKTKNIFLDSTVGQSLHKKALKTVSLYWYLYKTAGKGKWYKWFPAETLFLIFLKNSHLGKSLVKKVLETKKFHVQIINSRKKKTFLQSKTDI